jgi:DNA polymerase alpha subunit A
LLEEIGATLPEKWESKFHLCLRTNILSCVLDEILSGKSREEVVDNIHNYLRQKAEEIRSGVIPLEKFVITKGLTKAPEEYNDIKGQAHVYVAKRMKQQGKRVAVGDYIPFVICQGAAELSYAEKAYHPEEVKNNQLQIGRLMTCAFLRYLDFQWYLAQQIHPPISRICDSIQGTDYAHIADCLGLDSRAYQRATSSFFEWDEDMEFKPSSKMDADEKYKGVEKFKLICGNCRRYAIPQFQG